MTKIAAAILAAGLTLIASTAANAASDTASVRQAIRTMFKLSNAGDMSATKYYVEDGTAIDEFAPYGWSKFGDWFKDAGTYFKANAISDPRLVITKFRHVNVTGDRAYVVLSVVYTTKENGKRKKEPGSQVFALAKQADGWRIVSFAWFGKMGVDAGADATAITALVQDFATATGTGNPGATISAVTDEFAPYAWTGASAAADWSASLQKMSAGDHDTDLVIAPEAASQLSITGDRGYATFPTLLTFKHNNKAMKEHGAFAFAFEKSGGAWHITTWAWATD